MPFGVLIGACLVPRLTPFLGGVFCVALRVCGTNGLRVRRAVRLAVVLSRCKDRIATPPLRV